MLYFTLVAILRSSWQELQQKQSYFIKAGLKESQAKGKSQKKKYCNWDISINSIYYIYYVFFFFSDKEYCI